MQDSGRLYGSNSFSQHGPVHDQGRPDRERLPARQEFKPARVFRTVVGYVNPCRVQIISNIIDLFPGVVSVFFRSQLPVDIFQKL